MTLYAHEVTRRCAYCNNDIKYYIAIKLDKDRQPKHRFRVLQCLQCGRESVAYSFQTSSKPLIMPLLEDPVKHLPLNVAHAYEEARIAFSAGAFTGCVLVCRNILAHVAHDLGSGKKDRFTDYVVYLKESGRVTKSMGEWADDIRRYGNDAAHDIELRDEKRAKDVLALTKYLLMYVYEVEAEHKSPKST